MSGFDTLVALVTGASRGAGRAIALELGSSRATVYVTGRSVRGGPTTDNVPGTIEDTASGVTERGGTGIAVTGRGNRVLQNAVYSNLGDGIAIAGGTAANANVVKGNAVGAP